MSLDIDIGALWTAINDTLPTFFAIMAPVIGISAGIAIVKWIGSAIVNAFKGGL